jgi:hypothetical protein
MARFFKLRLGRFAYVDLGAIGWYRSPMTIFLLLLALTSYAHAGNKIDLQWSICDASPEAVLAKLDSADAEESDSSVTYYDEAPPSFIQDGVTFRIKGEGAKRETSVKIRFEGEREIPEATCEWDRYGSQNRYTCEVAGDPGEAKIWSAAQLDFLSARYRNASVDGLKAFGPYPNRKWKLKHKDFKVTFDTVDTREAGHLMEMSMKVDYAARDASYEMGSHWLAKNGVSLCGTQESKTARLFRALGLLR